MKDVIVLEVNGKDDVLCQIEIETPNEFFLINDTEPILNNRIFEDFIDEVFLFIVDEIIPEFGKKNIKDVYVTFIDNYDEFICSLVFDRFKLRRKRYRVKLIDWKKSGYVFKYVNEDEVAEDMHEE